MKFSQSKLVVKNLGFLWLFRRPDSPGDEKSPWNLLLVQDFFHQQHYVLLLVVISKIFYFHPDPFGYDPIWVETTN